MFCLITPSKLKVMGSNTGFLNLFYFTSGEALSGLIGLGGGDTWTVGKYFGADLATFPSCFVTFGVKMAETGGGINISEKILSIS